MNIYRALVNGKIVFEAKVAPGISHDKAWRGAIEAYTKAKNDDTEVSTSPG